MTFLKITNQINFKLIKLYVCFSILLWSSPTSTLFKEAQTFFLQLLSLAKDSYISYVLELEGHQQTIRHPAPGDGGQRAPS